MYEIEKNVPAPRTGRKYPFSKMEVGDSFVSPDVPMQKLANAARMWGRKRNAKFLVGTFGGGARVWRVA